jgi:hypothetical protein
MPSKPRWQAWRRTSSPSPISSIELQAGNIGQDRLKQRLPLDERQVCRVAAVEIQEVEGVKDKAHAARPVSCRLCLGETRKAVLAHATSFAVEIRALRRDGLKRRCHAGIFGAPVEAGPGQNPGPAALNARRHAETVELVQPLRP